jgi:hypothetical protein
MTGRTSDTVVENRHYLQGKFDFRLLQSTLIVLQRVKGPTLELRGPKVGIWPYNTSFHVRFTLFIFWCVLLSMSV